MANFKKKNNNKSFAFVEDKTINPNEVPNKIEIQNGRGDTAMIMKQKKRGAPQKNEINKKKYCISVNCTAAQKEKLEERAEELGLSISAYMMLKANQ